MNTHTHILTQEHQMTSKKNVWLHFQWICRQDGVHTHTHTQTSLATVMIHAGCTFNWFFLKNTYFFYWQLSQEQQLVVLRWYIISEHIKWSAILQWWYKFTQWNWLLLKRDCRKGRPYEPFGNTNDVRRQLHDNAQWTWLLMLLSYCSVTDHSLFSQWSFVCHHYARVA